MFSSALVCLLAGLCRNYSTDFHKIRWKGGTLGLAMEDTVRFWWKSRSHYIRVRVSFTVTARCGHLHTPHGRRLCYLACLIVKIL